MNRDLDDVDDLRVRLTQEMFRKGVFPGTNALVTFVPQGGKASAKIKEAIDEMGEGRWFPASGGWRVKCPYVGQEFDKGLFTIEEGGWDHVHCDICNRTINAGHSCRVSEDKEEFYVICDECFSGLKKSGQP